MQLRIVAGVERIEPFTTVLMQGNTPHAGPGSNGFRAILFCTATLQEQEPVTPNGSVFDGSGTDVVESGGYNDEQMSDEKFWHHLIGYLRSVEYQSEKERDVILTFLYEKYAWAVATSAGHNAREGSIPESMWPNSMKTFRVHTDRIEKCAKALGEESSQENQMNLDRAIACMANMHMDLKIGRKKSSSDSNEGAGHSGHDDREYTRKRVYNLRG